MINSTIFELTSRLYPEKMYKGLKQGYIDMHANTECFIKFKSYIKNNINNLKLKYICSIGNSKIYELVITNNVTESCHSIFFEVSACLNADLYTNIGYYMTFDNIMGNWYSMDKSKSKMFKRYSSGKIAIKSYIKELLQYI